MNKSRFTAIKRTMQAHQQERYPGITRSIADHGRTARGVRNEREVAMTLRTGLASRREQVATKLRAVFGRCGSLAAFRDALQEQGMELYLRNARPQGVRVDGVKYRLSSLGIDRDALTRMERAPARRADLLALRERGREQERDAPMRRSLSRTRKEGASGEPLRK